MAIDLSRFVATFFEESREGLDAMEAGLLRLDRGEGDVETINTVFRAAHSMKGGAGSFGFTAITELTHLLETLLDQMRSGKRSITRDATDALLDSVDVLRGLLEAARSGGPIDAARLAAMCERFNAMLAGEASAAAPPATTPAAVPGVAAAPARGALRIVFKPHRHLFATGNDPLRILRELVELGASRIECNVDTLPSYAELDPADCHLAWRIEFDEAPPRAAIDDVFAWVEGDCDLSVEVDAAPAAELAAPAPTGPVASSVPAPAGNVVALNPPERKPEAPQAPQAETSIRVNISKVDALINLVGELVITQAMLKQLSDTLDPVLNEKLLNGLSLLERNTRDLQDAVMGVRMMPVDFVFSRFPRVVRDLAGKLGKSVRLKVSGEGTELDKGVIEKISDPLVHLIRNAVDHGVEMPEARRAAGKDETGTIALSAQHQGGHIVIEVADDGRGLDRERILAKAAERGIAVAPDAPDGEVYALIFAPGFSTADKVTDVSGRGVGMDVVRKNIDALGGSVEIASSKGMGTRITIRLPLTLAILDAMSVAVGGEIFMIPLTNVIESLQPRAEDVKTVSGSGRLLRVRGEFLPLLSLGRMFSVPEQRSAREQVVVIVEGDNRKLAVEVDELVGQQQVVIKSLEANYRRIAGISGATILGDGRVALILDVGGVARGLSQAA